MFNTLLQRDNKIAVAKEKEKCTQFYTLLYSIHIKQQTEAWLWYQYTS